MNLIFATFNPHKVDEARALLDPSFSLIGLRALGHDQILEETHQSLEENAQQKAKFVFEKFGEPCFSDDSGLEVDALFGAPGVHSAEFAGPQRSDADNIALLLRRMEGNVNRQARFRTVIALQLTPTLTHIFEGVVQGGIGEAPAGTNGFGYDPIFIPVGEVATFGQLSRERKNQLSHRAMAFKKLNAFLKTIKTSFQRSL